MRHVTVGPGRVLARRGAGWIEEGLLHEEDIGMLGAVSYTHLRAHETVLDLVCRLLLEKKNIISKKSNDGYIQS